MIYHEVIGKRLVALQQIRSGLKVFGFLDVLMKYPKILEPVFVYKEDYLTPSVLLSTFHYDESKEEYPSVHEFFVRFVNECTYADLEKLLIYCTGCKLLPLKHIQVKYVKQDGLFSSTCLTHLKVPTGFESYENFKLCFNALLPNNGKAFTSV